MPNPEIEWTKVDEAPALATFSLLPIVEAFVGAAGVSVKLKDISLAGRILANVLRQAQAGAAYQRRAHRTRRAHYCDPKPTSSSCPTSPPRFRSSRPRSRNCKARATMFRTIRTTRRRKPRKTSSPAMPRCLAASSIRYCAKAIPTGVPPEPSSNTRATIHTRWAPGAPAPNRMSLTCRAAITSARKSRPPSRRQPTSASNWSALTAPSRC